MISQTYKKVLLGSILTILCIGIFQSRTYIQKLEKDYKNLQEKFSSLETLNQKQEQKLSFINFALKKTTITPYVPYLGGINGGGKFYANGEPVLPLAASRRALKNGSVAMGDYILLIGQIKDTKGSTIKDHSFDIHVPDMGVANLIGKRPALYLNLSNSPIFQ